MRTVDIHAHWYPVEWLNLFEKDGLKEGAVLERHAKGYRLRAKHIVNAFDERFVDLASRIATMEEKGIDVRIALDVIRMAHHRLYDVALIFSQDQDLSEVAEEIRVIAGEQNRWIKIASAFPFSPTTRNRRGVNKTDWIRIDRATYDRCLDRRDYRPRRV